MRWGTGRGRPSFSVGMFVCFVFSIIYKTETDFEVRKLVLQFRGNLKPAVYIWQRCSQAQHVKLQHHKGVLMQSSRVRDKGRKSVLGSMMGILFRGSKGKRVLAQTRNGKVDKEQLSIDSWIQNVKRIPSHSYKGKFKQGKTQEVIGFPNQELLLTLAH